MKSDEALFQYCLRLGDSSLVLGHRLSEWCGHGPILEEDIALTNIALDLIGQSRILLSHAAEVEGKGRTEDDLAYLRDVMNFRNFLLVEQPNGDFACTMARQFLYSNYCYHLYAELKNSSNSILAAFAEKSLKEITYHLRHCSEWVVRLGDGTEKSKYKIQAAFDDLWMFTSDMFAMDEVDSTLIKEGVAVDLNLVKNKWDKTVTEILAKAKLNIPQNSFMLVGSREGKHTEHLGYLLAEMQFLPRAYPGAKW